MHALKLANSSALFILHGIRKIVKHWSRATKIKNEMKCLNHNNLTIVNPKMNLILYLKIINAHRPMWAYVNIRKTKQMEITKTTAFFL